MTLSEMKDVWGTTRKFAVPLAEYLDRIGFTQRTGDKRSLVSDR
jgi:selenocysteine-specific elongation factor